MGNCPTYHVFIRFRHGMGIDLFVKAVASAEELVHHEVALRREADFIVYHPAQFHKPWL